MSIRTRHPGNNMSVRSGAARRWLNKMDLIERMNRIQWEAYVNRGRRQLIHKGGKP